MTPAFYRRTWKGETFDELPISIPCRGKRHANRKKKPAKSYLCVFGHISCQIASGIDQQAILRIPPLAISTERNWFPVAGYYAVHRKQRVRGGRNSSRTDGPLVPRFMNTHDRHMVRSRSILVHVAFL